MIYQKEPITHNNGGHEDFPESLMSYVEFDKFMSKIKWVKIENEDQTASKDGFYLFKCHGDNHYFYEFYELVKGDLICKHYLDHHFDGWAVVVPESYYIANMIEREYIMKNWGIIDCV